MLTVHLPDGRQRQFQPPRGNRRALAQLLHDRGWPLNTRCDQRGLCNGCQVELLSGSLEALDAADPGERLGARRLVRACQVRLVADQPAEIRIPARSLLAHQPQVVTSFSLEVPRAHDPLWQRVTLCGDDLPRVGPDSAAICDAVAAVRERDLPVRSSAADAAWAAGEDGQIRVQLECREDHWRATPWTEPSAAGRNLGLAIDIGTTTVVVLLVDLADGRVLETAAALNAQTRLGDNVLTRINLCMSDPGKLRRLQEAVARRTLRPLLREVLTRAGAVPDEVRTLTVAGNTTMLHLLAGVDPSPMGLAPFTPAFLEHRVSTTEALGLGEQRLPPKRGGGQDDPEDRGVPVHLLPGAAAYIGADVMAGVLASGMAYRRETCLLVDVGTNGEIVLKHGDRFLACATAAGPAFEGTGLSCGMRAGRGAISHIGFSGGTWEPELEVIDGAAPIGICGTAYVDFLARGRAAGLLGPTGRYTPEAAKHPRGDQRDSIRHFRIARSPDGEAILISEADIASLLQAKAAIAAGILCLLARASLRPEEVATLYLAGGFGFHMNVDSVLGSGLLPGFDRGHVRLVGNTSLAGAYLSLLDSTALAEIKRISEGVETVELNLDPEFESTYIEQMILPDPSEEAAVERKGQV